LNPNHQVIFEDNKCIGTSVIAGGNGIMTYGGGVAHHIYSAANLFTQVWGNDREVMTFDNRGNQYLGPVTGIDEAGTNISTQGRGASVGNGNGYSVVGGALVIVNGTGAGQIRRIISFVMHDNSSDAGWFEIDRPFDVLPTTTAAHAGSRITSYIACVPFRGQSIFAYNHYADTGAFQYYGIGFNNVAYQNTAERFGGFLSWGQWRQGGYPKQEVAPFINPNVRNEWIENVVTEGSTADHQQNLINTTGSFGDSLATSGNPFTIIGTMKGCGTTGDAVLACRGSNQLISFRGNKVLSNGGFQIGASSEVLLESNSVASTPPQSIGFPPTSNVSAFQVSPGAVGCIERNNTAN
jgi:hypothetical protein